MLSTICRARRILTSSIAYLCPKRDVMGVLVTTGFHRRTIPSALPVTRTWSSRSRWKQCTPWGRREVNVHAFKLKRNSGFLLSSSIATHFSPRGMNGPRTSEKLRAEKPRHCRNSNLRFLYCYKQRGMLEEKRTKVINHYVELKIFIEDLKYVLDFFFIYIPLKIIMGKKTHTYYIFSPSRYYLAGSTK